VVARGVVFVVAAGNDNIDDKYVTPASIPWAITVSAITDSGGKCGGAGPAIQQYRTHLSHLGSYLILTTYILYRLLGIHYC
jgi:hypothetical protein